MSDYYREIIDNYKVKHMQIQTIDSCDSKCIMCPHKDAPITNKKMEDWVFEKIIKDTAEAIDAGRIDKNIYIRTFFHNESLLDSSIFDKIEYIREILPECFILMNTNGFLMPQLKNKIISSKLNEFTWSAYGEDEDLFYKITGIKKSQKQIDEIVKAFNYIKENKPSSMEVRRLRTDVKILEIEDKGLNIWDTNKFHSRAGFYRDKNKKVDTIYGCTGCTSAYHENIYGCASVGSERNGVPRNRHRDLSFLNFYANGDSNLCCQDWLRETVMGNIKTQTILDLMRSDKWYEIKSKSLGADSEPDFICKRCEFASTDPNFLDSILPKK